MAGFTSGSVIGDDYDHDDDHDGDDDDDEEEGIVGDYDGNGVQERCGGGGVWGARCDEGQGTLSSPPPPPPPNGDADDDESTYLFFSYCYILLYSTSKLGHQMQEK